MKTDSKKKICILGKSGAGKTSLSRRLTEKENYKHCSYQESTIGVAFMSAKYNDEKGQLHQFDIWDTAGQERYRSLAPMYYRNSSAALIVYDITNDESWKEIYYWVKEIKNNIDTDIPIILVGNKYDMKNNTGIDYDKIENYTKENDIINIFCSALNGYNCEKILELLVKKIEEKASDNFNTQTNKNTNSLEEDKDRPYYNCCL
jgi:small GTP-binding protein